MGDVRYFDTNGYFIPVYTFESGNGGQSGFWQKWCPLILRTNCSGVIGFGSSSGASSSSTELYYIIPPIIAAVILLIAAVFLIACCCCKRKPRQSQHRDEEIGSQPGASSSIPPSKSKHSKSRQDNKNKTSTPCCQQCCFPCLPRCACCYDCCCDCCCKPLVEGGEMSESTKKPGSVAVVSEEFHTPSTAKQLPKKPSLTNAQNPKSQGVRKISFAEPMISKAPDVVSKQSELKHLQKSSDKSGPSKTTKNETVPHQPISTSTVAKVTNQNEPPKRQAELSTIGLLTNSSDSKAEMPSKESAMSHLVKDLSHPATSKVVTMKAARLANQTAASSELQLEAADAASARLPLAQDVGQTTTQESGQIQVVASVTESDVSVSRLKASSTTTKTASMAASIKVVSKLASKSNAKESNSSKATAAAITNLEHKTEVKEDAKEIDPPIVEAPEPPPARRMSISRRSGPINLDGKDAEKLPVSHRSSLAESRVEASKKEIQSDKVSMATKQKVVSAIIKVSKVASGFKISPGKGSNTSKDAKPALQKASEESRQKETEQHASASQKAPSLNVKTSVETEKASVSWNRVLIAAKLIRNLKRSIVKRSREEKPKLKVIPQQKTVHENVEVPTSGGHSTVQQSNTKQEHLKTPEKSLIPGKIPESGKDSSMLTHLQEAKPNPEDLQLETRSKGKLSAMVTHLPEAKQNAEDMQLKGSSKVGTVQKKQKSSPDNVAILPMAEAALAARDISPVTVQPHRAKFPEASVIAAVKFQQLLEMQRKKASKEQKVPAVDPLIAADAKAAPTITSPDDRILEKADIDISSIEGRKNSVSFMSVLFISKFKRKLSKIRTRLPPSIAEEHIARKAVALDTVQPATTAKIRNAATPTVSPANRASKLKPVSQPKAGNLEAVLRQKVNEAMKLPKIEAKIAAAANASSTSLQKTPKIVTRKPPAPPALPIQVQKSTAAVKSTPLPIDKKVPVKTAHPIQIQREAAVKFEPIPIDKKAPVKKLETVTKLNQTMLKVERPKVIVPVALAPPKLKATPQVVPGPPRKKQKVEPLKQPRPQTINRATSKPIAAARKHVVVAKRKSPEIPAPQPNKRTKIEKPNPKSIPQTLDKTESKQVMQDHQVVPTVKEVRKIVAVRRSVRPTINLSREGHRIPSPTYTKINEARKQRIKDTEKFRKMPKTTDGTLPSKFDHAPSGWQLRQRDRFDLTKKVTEMDSPRRLDLVRPSPRFSVNNRIEKPIAHSVEPQTSDYHRQPPQQVQFSSSHDQISNIPTFRETYRPSDGNNLMASMGRRSKPKACPPASLRRFDDSREIRNRDHVAQLFQDQQYFAPSHRVYDSYETARNNYAHSTFHHHQDFDFK